MTYDKDLVTESSQQLNETLLSNRKMTENSLRMRAMAYLAQAKANLLTETIFEVESSRKHMQEELIYKDEMMLAQSRNAAMGEMISMIAHQWRQPISVIAMGANNIIADIELGDIQENRLRKYTTDILEKVKELSKTIDDFKNFFRPDKELSNVLITDVFNDVFSVVGESLRNAGIEVKTEYYNDRVFTTYSRELMQVLINILKNAKEAIGQSDKIQKRILIVTYEAKDAIGIKICDSGEGIDEEIINKIFDPYFSTKSQNVGTGLGLYMSKTIIEKHLNGIIVAYNIKSGACFEIELPYNLRVENHSE